MLLILAVGNNGLFQRAKDGRTAAMLEKGEYKLTTNYLNEGLKSYIGEGKYELEEVANGWIVTIVKSGRKYEIEGEESKYPVEGVTPTDPQIFTYKLNEDGNTITITGFKSKYESTYYRGTLDRPLENSADPLVYPYSIDGHTGTSIKLEGYGGVDQVSKIIIPNTVKSIYHSGYGGWFNVDEVIRSDSTVVYVKRYGDDRLPCTK